VVVLVIAYDETGTKMALTVSTTPATKNLEKAIFYHLTITSDRFP